MRSTLLNAKSIRMKGMVVPVKGLKDHWQLTILGARLLIAWRELGYTHESATKPPRDTVL